MKKTIYIILFTFLGILLQLLVHALVEMWYINLLLTNFDRYGFGLSWDNWYLIHSIGTLILLCAGILLGWWQGGYWWKRIYPVAK